MLIKRWDGVRWTGVISPNVGTHDNTLHAVAASGASDVWAVGEYYDDNNFERTLTLRWDGASWKVIASPNVSPNQVVSNNRLAGVVTLGANNAWAIGDYDDGGSQRPLILRWDGASWQSVAAPEPAGATNIKLMGIAAVSANDIWAVGRYYDSGFNQKTLTIHWNGSQWAIRPSPNPNTFLNALNGVAASSANDVWAVGYTSDGSGYKTLALHWNGAAWQAASSPSPDGTNNELLAIAASGARDIWAVGYAGISADDGQPLILHWDGAAWRAVARPDTGKGALASATRLPGADVWAAGTDTTGSVTLPRVERYRVTRPTRNVYLPVTIR
jgi:hypothetical protein